MHHARDAPVENAVARLEGGYEERTSGVVSSATGIRRAEASQIGVLGCPMATSAPLRPWDHQQVPSRSALAPSLLVTHVTRAVRELHVFPVTTTNIYNTIKR